MVERTQPTPLQRLPFRSAIALAHCRSHHELHLVVPRGDGASRRQVEHDHLRQRDGHEHEARHHPDVDRFHVPDLKKVLQFFTREEKRRLQALPKLFPRPLYVGNCEDCMSACFKTDLQLHGLWTAMTCAAICGKNQECQTKNRATVSLSRQRVTAFKKEDGGEVCAPSMRAANTKVRLMRAYF